MAHQPGGPLEPEPWYVVEGAGKPSIDLWVPKAAFHDALRQQGSADGGGTIPYPEDLQDESGGKSMSQAVAPHTDEPGTKRLQSGSPAPPRASGERWYGARPALSYER